MDRIIHWNITSYHSNFEELKKLISDHNDPACLCLQETRHGDKALRPPSRYRIYQSNKRRDDNHERGVALLINNKIHSERIPLILGNNVEAVAARVWMGKYYSICSLYLSPSLPVRKNDITDLIAQLPEPFLLLGDMNARHSLWGEPTNNPKGNLFEELLIEEDLALLNDQHKTHYNIQNDTSTLIDLSISSANACLDFSASVVECRHGSDHHPVKIEKTEIPVIAEPSLRFKTEKANWTKFNQLTDNFSPADQTADINEKVAHLTKFILETAEASIPISYGRRNGKIPLPWWDNSCKEAHAARKRAQRALHRSPTEVNKITVRRLNALCRRTFKEAKKNSWIRFVSSINVNTSLSEIWKKIKKLNGKFSAHPAPLLRDADGNLSSDPDITSNIFAEAFSEVSSGANYPVQFQRTQKLKERKPLNFSEPALTRANYNEALNMRELNSALASVGETSPGIDGVAYSMIKNSSQSFRIQILHLFNEIFQKGVFPDTWKIASIIPIPKPNKDHSSPLNFRPISLTSCLCKLLEKMVNARLMWYLERKGYLNNKQSGFRKGRSTTDCIVQLTADMQQAIIDKKHTIAVFFDLQKAYDTSWRRGILNKLHSFGLRGNLPIFIQNFLSGRQVKVKIGSSLSEAKNIEQGVPQGSVLSCTLFAIAIDGVLDVIPKGVKAALYVDDLTIYASGTPECAKRKVSTTIRNLEKWCLQTGFQFSASKTVSMHVCRVRNCGKHAEGLELNGNAIHCKESLTYLGVVFDNSLRFHKHILYLRDECHRRLNALKHLSHTSWGADSKTLLRIYTALIKSKIEYGVEAYGSTCQSNRNKLDPIQNSALRIATGAFKTSPIISLEVLTGTRSLAASRKEKLANYVVRVIANPSNPLQHIFNRRNLAQEGEDEDDDEEEEEDDDEEEEDDSERRLGAPRTPTKFEKLSIMYRAKAAYSDFQLSAREIFSEKPAKQAPWMLNNLSVCDDIIQNAKNQIREETLRMIYNHHLRSHTVDDLLIYTDGSKTDDGVAMAIAGFRQQEGIMPESRRIPDRSSVFTAELYAILNATRKANQCTIPNSIVIISDSKSAIQTASQLAPKNPIAVMIQKLMSESDKNFSLCWVPSHVGIEGNEAADIAAKEGTKADSIAALPVPKGDIHAHIRKESKAAWQHCWTSIAEPDNKLRQITDDLSPLPNSTCCNRRWERTLARLRLGHTRLTHGYLMAGDPPPFCEHCGEGTRLSIKHILVECPHHQLARLRAYNRSTLTLKEMLKVGDTGPAGPLAKYIEAINLTNLL